MLAWFGTNLEDRSRAVLVIKVFTNKTRYINHIRLFNFLESMITKKNEIDPIENPQGFELIHQIACSVV